MLLRGNYDLKDEGVMDRTHLRWFTPKTYREMFTNCGYDVVSLGPVTLGPKAKMFNKLLGKKASHLLWRQISLTACCS